MKDAEKRISGKTRAVIHYKIVHLSQNSPAKITIEPIIEPKYKSEVAIGRPFSDVMHNLRFIKTKKTVPEDMEYHDAEKYVEISNLRTTHLPEITVMSGRSKVKIDEQFEKNITQAIGEDEFESDTIIGKLDAINIHGKKTCYIYPNVGAKRIRCDFGDPLEEKIIGALGHRVEIMGRVRYKSWDNYPYAIDVEDILSVYPKEKELPPFSSIAGMQKDIIDGTNSTEFIRKLRDKEW